MAPKKTLLAATFLLLSLGTVSISHAASPALVLTPSSVVQGEPVMISLQGVTATSQIKSLTFDGVKVGIFLHNAQPTAVIGIDLNKAPSMYTVKATLTDGQVLEQTLIVTAREKIEAPLGIPDSLGGNTTSSQQNLVSSLSKENTILKTLRTNAKALWNTEFVFPVANPVVTDSYGYSRATGSYLIAHKGTDFHAPEGTQVFAMNRGVVRLIKNSPVYGKMIVIDHGLGISTLYLHLSKIKVSQGQLVTPGQLIGLSGQTGYAEGPHLHVSVWINNISIDPMKFMALFGKQ